MFMKLTELNGHEITERFIQVLKEKNISDKELYEMLGIYEQSWTQWKKRGIPAKYHYNLAKMLGVNIKWVVEGTGLKYASTKYEVKDLTTNDYEVITPDENTAAAITIIKHLLPSQKQQWLKQGRLLMEDAEQLRKEQQALRDQ